MDKIMKELCPQCKEQTLTRHPSIGTVPIHFRADTVLEVPILTSVYRCDTCGVVDVPRDRLDEGEIETSQEFIRALTSRFLTREKAAVREGREL